MPLFVHAVNKPDIQPWKMPERFRHDVTYFMTPPGGARNIPPLEKGEYWICLEDSRRWLDDLTVSVVSPLDSASKAEIELTEEQEQWLEWMVQHQIERIRLA